MAINQKYLDDLNSLYQQIFEKYPDLEKIEVPKMDCEIVQEFIRPDGTVLRCIHQNAGLFSCGTR